MRASFDNPAARAVIFFLSCRRSTAELAAGSFPTASSLGFSLVFEAEAQKCGHKS
jgi:hypothetical protein